MDRLILATSNPGKVRELRRLLEGCGFEAVAAGDLGIALEVEETGDTYEENARLKARAYAAAGEGLALADDSGIEVDVLGGRPGVQSARYGGPGLDDAGRVACLLAELAEVPLRRRGARFRAVVVVAGRHRGRCVDAAFEGMREGAIAMAPRGSGGFGYDPVFEAGGETEAELTPAEKDSVSHRGQAVRAAAAYLRELAR